MQDYNFSADFIFMGLKDFVCGLSAMPNMQYANSNTVVKVQQPSIENVVVLSE